MKWHWRERLFPRRVASLQYAHWLPVEAGAVLGITAFQSGILVACESGVWQLRQDYVDMRFTIEKIL